jgi:hypothetical protein
MSPAAELPPLNEETAQPGTPLRPYSVTYDEAFVRMFLDKTGESLDAYRDETGVRVPPGVFLGAYARLLHETYHYEAGVHVSSDLAILRTPPLGTHATVTGKVARLFEKNGDRYVVVALEVTGDSGTVFARVEHTSIYQFKSRAGA